MFATLRTFTARTAQLEASLRDPRDEYFYGDDASAASSHNCRIGLHGGVALLAKAASLGSGLRLALQTDSFVVHPTVET